MKCFLNCCERTHEPILLPDGSPVVVGRSRQTKIADKKCSKTQVKMTANYKSKEVRVEQLGSNPSSVGGKELGQGESAVLVPGEKIGLLHEKYQYFVSFTPSTSEPIKNPGAKSSSQPKAVTDKLKSERSRVSKMNNKRKIMESGDTGSQPTKKHKRSPEGGNKDGIGMGSEHKKCLEAIDYDEVRKEFGEEMVQELKTMKNKTLYTSAGPSGRVSESVPSKLCVSSTYSKWDEIPGELILFKSKGVEGKGKVAGFDMDGTIITTKSGKVFPTNTADWKILMPEIPGRLKKLWSEGYKVVLFTNQNGIAKKKVSVPDFKTKVENIVHLLGVPVQVLISPGTGHYRKPSTGMWTYLIGKANEGVTVDTENSMYIGDAAGRPAGWEPKRKKDFSCSDRAFAANIGIQFYTPEEFFLSKSPAPFNWPAFNPRKLQDGPLFSPSTSNLTTKDPELILMVGLPASGKTTFAKEHLVPKGYIRINRDTLGTWQKCVSACRAALSQGQRVVVDNTSPDKETRKRYIECAQQANVPSRCFVMDVSIDHAKHNNTVRETTNTDTNYKHVGFIAFNSYKSSYQEPQLSEGFTEILKIHFRPKFTDNATKELYYQFLHA